MVEITAPVSLVRVARVHGPHGVRGEVRAESLGGDIRRFAPGVRLQTEAGRHVLTIESARDIGSGQILLCFRELTDREQASRLGGTYLCTDEEHLRPLGPNEWFVFRLVGLRARTASGAQLGEVV
ncbi:MAG TPA: ribosome maturation factor RimM, partial [Candidatus Sulfotelmatobacter sp.]|nr:ribosome maturation factor RimM [Candidatus Sulfotelmatobacter sp.]